MSVCDFSEIEKNGVTIKIFIRMGIGYTVLGAHIVCEVKVKQIQWVQCR